MFAGLSVQPFSASSPPGIVEVAGKSVIVFRA